VRHPHHDNAEQPRVPKGHPHGGRWTDGNHGQATILEEGDRADGGYGKETLVQQAFLGPAPFLVPPAVQALRSALALFAALSTRNSPEKRAIITFRAREYRRTGPEMWEVEEVRQLNREEAEDICKRLGQVQKLTDLGALEVGKNPFLEPAAYGTKVHKFVETKINELGEAGFLAEKSELKSAEAAKQAGGQVESGTLGSVRIDAYENRGNGTVCVYDIKTGANVLRPWRMRELAGPIREADPIDLGPERLQEMRANARKRGIINVVRIIVIQVKPNVPRAPRFAR
jgi:hypothetical protein